jgi:hypothetical protein
MCFFSNQTHGHGALASITLRLVLAITGGGYLN